MSRRMMSVGARLGRGWSPIAMLIVVSAVAASSGMDRSGLAADKPAETSHLVRVRGVVGANLFESGIRRGVPEKIMRQVVALLGFIVDFQRDLRAADGFELLYEQSFLPSGSPGRPGSLVYAGLALKDRRFGVWRFQKPGGVSDYFNSKGESVRNGLLRTPVDAARISSGFGMRKHPILRFARLHRGIDFAVPTGTPVFAAGDGIVEIAGLDTVYGKFVRIRHANDFRTLYAHLSRISKGIRRGAKVRQRRVIGKSGVSGITTGPHLHYEVWRGQERINPTGLRMRPTVTLRGKVLTAFRWQAVMTRLRPVVWLGEPVPAAPNRR